ncbi:MAG: hypothetical protein JSW58_06445 [Candidatus Latescibacterota bacterium]|nr:MAG: hypothetical protein JSW58_06445 [Candidatus Latescibacterota bacterium]
MTSKRDIGKLLAEILSVIRTEQSLFGRSVGIAKGFGFVHSKDLFEELEVQKSKDRSKVESFVWKHFPSMKEEEARDYHLSKQKGFFFKTLRGEIKALEGSLAELLNRLHSNLEYYERRGKFFREALVLALYLHKVQQLYDIILRIIMEWDEETSEELMWDFNHWKSKIRKFRVSKKKKGEIVK